MSSYAFFDVLRMFFMYLVIVITWDYLKNKVVSLLNNRKGVTDEASD